MKRTLRALLAAAAISFTAPAAADSFMPPSVQEVTSHDGSVVVTVVPAMLSCAVGEADCEPAARAVVEHVRGGYRSGSRTVRLVNPEAPGQVLVTDDGERLLTVDDYARYGFGENVLVVYGSQGEVIARHALADFLPEEHIASLPRTVSTLRWWAAPVRIEPGTHRAIVSVVQVPPGEDWSALDEEGLELLLDLDTGEIRQPSGAPWEHALTADDLRLRREAEDTFHPRCGGYTPWIVPDPAAQWQRDRFQQLCRSGGTQ